MLHINPTNFSFAYGTCVKLNKRYFLFKPSRSSRRFALNT